MTEPFGMLPHPGMIRRTLPRKIEGDLEAEPLRLRAKGVEVRDTAEPGLDGRVPAGVRPDGPRAPRIAGLGGQRIVRSLAKARPNRMNRREIHDVEAEIGDARKRRCGLAKRRAAA